MTPNNNHIAPLSPQKGDSIAPNNEASSLNHTKSCSLDEQIRVAISHAIQGVQEYTAKDINDYYENRSKWVNLSADTITRLITEARKDQIMQDFNQVSLDTTIDEAIINSIRDNQLAELEATLKEQDNG